MATNPQSKGAPSAAAKGHSFRVLEPQLAACLLTNLGSIVTQDELDELDELRRRFHIPLSITMKAPEMGEFPLRP